jgi:hypothetical protein
VALRPLASPGLMLAGARARATDSVTGKTRRRPSAARRAAVDRDSDCSPDSSRIKVGSWPSTVVSGGPGPPPAPRLVTRAESNPGARVAIGPDENR